MVFFVKQVECGLDLPPFDLCVEVFKFYVKCSGFMTSHGIMLIIAFSKLC